MVAAPPPPLVSYVDRLHGWRASGPGVEATNDAGRHWHVVFRWRAGGGGADVTALVRTSAAAGLVTFSYSATFVTNDGGAHWYVVAGPPNDPAVGDQVVGRGPLLFGSRADAILQAEQWPPAQLRCGGRWYHVVQSPIGDYGPAPRNICLGGPGATIHTYVVLAEPPDPATGYERTVQVRALTSVGLVYDVLDESSRLVETGTLPLERPEWSWADRNHAWRPTIAGLEATDDGGHHWRLVLGTPRTSGASADRPIRTSARSGIVGVSGRLFVTNDGGRHWYQAQGGPAEPALGRGSLLFGTGGWSIERAVPWPLPRLRCTGRWVHSAEYFNPLSAGPRPRRICLQDSGVTVRMKTVYRLPEPQSGWELLGEHLSGGTLTAAVFDTTSEPWRRVGTVVYRDGAGTFAPTR